MANEFSEIQAIDFALGNHIVCAFSGLNPEAGPRQWKEFLGRPTNKQVFREEADGPAEFLQRLISAGQTEKTLADGSKSKTPSLPLTYYYRKPGMTNGENRNFISRVVTVGEKYFSLIMVPLEIDYHLVFASWDKLSLDKLQLAWYYLIIRDSHFSVRYSIAGEPLDVPACIMDPKTIAFSDISVPRSEGRLFAVDSVMTVQTSVLFGADITPDTPGDITIIGQWTGYSCTDPGVLDPFCGD